MDGFEEGNGAENISENYMVIEENGISEEELALLNAQEEDEAHLEEILTAQNEMPYVKENRFLHIGTVYNHDRSLVRVVTDDRIIGLGLESVPPGIQYQEECDNFRKALHSILDEEIDKTEQTRNSLSLEYFIKIKLIK